MKKLLTFSLLFFAFSAKAQFNNSWIDYNKSYYKFQVVKDTLCRISQVALQAAGLGNTNAEDFQLWRNGEEVRLYSSVTNAPLGPSDYLEFYGRMNDGRPDNPLYRNADLQLASKYSLETDTASYFLTVNPNANNLRFMTASNTAPSLSTPDGYFMRNLTHYYRNQINRGEAKVVGEYVYSSSYDAGEGWASVTGYPCCDVIKEFFNLNVYTAGPANGLAVNVNAVGTAPNSRNLRIKLFQNEITAAPYSSAVDMSNFDYQKVAISNLPLSLLQNPGYVPVYVGSTSTNAYDRFVVASIGLTFPATFNFNNQRSFEFDLEPSATGNYLVIDNFNYGMLAPVLYDNTSGIRYVGEINSTPGKVKFVLPASSQKRSFILLSQELPMPISSLTKKDFVNITQASHQGDYMIISNPVLYDDGNGNNYVEQYRQYRSSFAGGGYNAKIYDINELTDQFAYGIKGHPDAIRGFIKFAQSQFLSRPQYCFLIGRAVNYIDQKLNEGNTLCGKINLVPTFGWPASDVLLAADNGATLPSVAMGRLGAINANEVEHYLNKVIEYEGVQNSSSASIADRAWMKNFIHVVGGKDSVENLSFKSYMNGYKAIAEDTLFGAHVETFTKTSAGVIQQASSQQIENLFNEGLGLIGYFGHSSANTFEFNLSNPDYYQNAGKYPFFNVSGCSAGNYYVYDQLRLSGYSSLSEKYVLANQRGSIGFLADTHYGIPPFLDFFNTSLYNHFCKTMYGNTIGNQIKAVNSDLGGATTTLDFFTRIHLEEINLHGDPAIKINSFSKPDYVIEEPQVKINPTIISVADNQFNVSIKMYNIGRAVGDSMWISVKRQLPNDSVKVLYRQLVPSIKSEDSLNLTVAINPTTDKGLNSIIVNLDETDRIEEQYETNNSVTKSFYIFEDEIRPAYPYNFAIVNKQNIEFIANTANPLMGNRNYEMEIDTTILFNSPFKKTYNQSGQGGLIEFQPNNLTFTDSTVYYWRVAISPQAGQPIIWNSFSFVYLPLSSPGFNQSHYYQHLQSKFDEIKLASSRSFVFQNDPKNLVIRTGLYPYYDYDRINVNLDFNQLENYGCIYNALQFYVFDTTTLMPWQNRNVTPTNGRFGSYKLCFNPGAQDTTRAFFEFPYGNAAYRKKAIDFIDSIPDGMYVAITNLGNKLSNNTFVDQWKVDTAVLGSGNSLYHKLQSIGFTQIDSFNRNLPFLYFFKKNRNDFSSTQIIGTEDSSYIDQSFNLLATATQGTIETPVYGPATQWTSFHWRGSQSDPSPTDSVSIDIVGLQSNGQADVLSTVFSAQDTSLSFVDASVYPYMKLVVHEKDDQFVTPYQLQYLRINAMPAPEGCVAPNLLFQAKDTLEQGEPLAFALAFKNISEVAFDSLLKVSMVITDQNNIPHPIIIPKRKSLIAGDTLQVLYTIDTKDLQGLNTLFIDFNPDNDQPEMYHFNNVLYKNFFVKTDRFHPLLDVTFDGVHILNKDIVAAKPHIYMELKDESKYLALKDTSLMKVQIRNPDQQLRTIHFGDTMRFNPADLSSGKNTASIDYEPYFKEDGDYELIVSGKDVVGNPAGNLEYHVSFSVINKPMISNLLNYPNPFTTSTAFVFTLTGAVIPQNMRIQILTITGKVVKEITQNELGPIHIGRNITEYKWDGTDRYGQQLANGVYIYRVITNLNGKSLDKYHAEGDNTDKFFNKGYGKMYLMR